MCNALRLSHMDIVAPSDLVAALSCYIGKHRCPLVVEVTEGFDQVKHD